MVVARVAVVGEGTPGVGVGIGGIVAVARPTVAVPVAWGTGVRGGAATVGDAGDIVGSSTVLTPVAVAGVGATVARCRRRRGASWRCSRR